jgi:hypothetical protein
VHDFLDRPFAYDSLGYLDPSSSAVGSVLTSITGSPTTANVLSTTMAAVNVPVATPIVAASVVGITPGALAATIVQATASSGDPGLQDVVESVFGPTEETLYDEAATAADLPDSIPIVEPTPIEPIDSYIGTYDVYLLN